jgi:hypothetical protein
MSKYARMVPHIWNFYCRMKRDVKELSNQRESHHLVCY